MSTGILSCDDFIPNVSEFRFNGKKFDNLNDMIEYSDKFCKESGCVFL